MMHDGSVCEDRAYRPDRDATPAAQTFAAVDLACAYCRHDWHGLTCNERVPAARATFGTTLRTERCGCRSQWTGG